VLCGCNSVSDGSALRLNDSNLFLEIQQAPNKYLGRYLGREVATGCLSVAHPPRTALQGHKAANSFHLCVLVDYLAPRGGVVLYLPHSRFDCCRFAKLVEIPLIS
jgi:hypothetical protein